MPVVAKPPCEIPSMKLGLPQAIALKKKSQSEVPSTSQKEPRCVCSVAADLRRQTLGGEEGSLAPQHLLVFEHPSFTLPFLFFMQEETAGALIAFD